MDNESALESEWIGNWRRKSSKIKYDNPWINVREDAVINPNGNPGIYGVVHFKNLAIGILPIDKNGYTWLVGQHRYPQNKYSWEIPEGGGKLGVEPLESANRELLEETGLEAKKWQRILEMDLSNSVSDEQAIIFLATDLEQKEPDPEDTEVLDIKHLHFDEVLNMVIEGEITDSLTVGAILKADWMRRNGHLQIAKI